ncbi:myb-like protein F [Stegodyphus dumicola]|uniref:myb-like protein F n=1 Tax=Stegodyphus dumicola TaxID=202533 RepID=UPI0015A78A4B|nr:myb-like protein F [Stegodyphus dumicola]
MTSFSETNSLNKGNSVSETKVKRLPEPNDVNRLIPPPGNRVNKDSKLSAHEETNISPPKSVQGRKKLNACGVHTKKQPENNFSYFKDKIVPAKTNTEFSVSTNPSEEIETSTGNTKKQENISSSAERCSNNLKPQTVNDVDSEKKQESENQNINNKSTNHKNLDAFTVPSETHLPSNTKDFRNVELSSCVDAEDNHKRDPVVLNLNASNLQPDKNSNSNVTDYNANENSCRSHSQTFLPDILSTLNNSELQGTQSSNNASSFTNEKLRNSNFSEKTNPENEINPKSKSILSQNNYVSHLLNSDILNYEMEMELKKLTALESLQANQSIYKLAFDENVTDHSEDDSRSPSPINPESQMPSSITNAEILIHEADSGSDAGSEDVELIPHRYESESSLHENKHVYVNKLSLAVELLRTEENLPYDDEFKRVVGENNQTAGKISRANQGEINLGFVDDYYSDILPEVHSRKDGQIPTSKFKVDVVNESKEYPRSSVITSENTFDDLNCESCEVATEITFERGNNQDQSEDVKTEFRRFGVRAQHYLSPRAALVNPCFCCIIM